jgi:hypothetical protein
LLGDRDAAAAHLSGTGLQPALTIGHRALVALSHYEYRDTGIGGYNEVGLEGARPVVVMDTHRFQARLNAGVPIGKPVTPVVDAPTDTATTTLH